MTMVYVYLGHSINMNADGNNGQGADLMNEFSHKFEKIDQSLLPITAKLQAINIIAMSQLSFYFSNLSFADKKLKELEDLIVSRVRQWTGLNNSSTRSFMFLPKRHGGLGLIKPSSTYHARKSAFMVSVLNSDDPQVRATSRCTFKLHMAKRKVPEVPDSESPNFGGYLLGGP